MRFNVLRLASVFGLILGLLCLGGPQKTQAQLWLQTARVITPIEDGPRRAFLDTLSSVMKRNGKEVWRSPDRETKQSASTLRDKLISEKGIGLGSANYAFIDYRFTIDNGSQFEQEITGVHFVYRPGPNQNDVSIMYLDAREPWVNQIIDQKGTTLRTNQAALIPFRRYLDFAHIARDEESQVVEIGGETVREGFDERKEALVRKVERMTYESFV